jgi:DNA polymerase-1
MILFFSDHENFRKKIYPEYKGHRNRKKPCGYKRVINKLKEEYEVIIMPTLEADDALGIYSTAHIGNTIVSPDKDMRQIPGLLYDFKESTLITPEDGNNWHYIQTLSGDQTDGYAGCPGIGVKRAVTLFEEEGYNWNTIKKTFAEKDLDEDVALMNARLAKILTVNDYDFQRQQPILWNPTFSDLGDDSGTGSKDEADK